jgi:hypothetical protein
MKKHFYSSCLFFIMFVVTATCLIAEQKVMHNINEREITFQEVVSCFEANNLKTKQEALKIDKEKSNIRQSKL